MLEFSKVARNMQFQELVYVPYSIYEEADLGVILVLSRENVID